MSAERHHERDAIADGVAACRDDRKSTGKTDSDDADLAVGAKLRLVACPLNRVLDGVGDLWRDLEALQVRCRDRQDAVARGSEIFRQADETRFVDPVAMHAGNENHRPPRLSRWTEEAGRDVAAARRHGNLRIARERLGSPRRGRCRRTGEICGANDEAEGVKVGKSERGRR